MILDNSMRVLLSLFYMLLKRSLNPGPRLRIWLSVFLVALGISFHMSAPVQADQPQPPPFVTSMSPSSGLTTGGTTVIITGGNFSNVTNVTFGGVQVTGGQIIVPTLLEVVSPPQTQPGPVNVVVTTAGGTSQPSNGSTFTYLPLPVIASVSPASGSTTGGTTVVISGSYFTGATTVTFSIPTTNIAATGIIQGISADGTILTVTSPALSAGTADILVTTPNARSNPIVADQYTYISPPGISAISPATGLITGGTTVAITGTNFYNVSSVLFGGRPATGGAIISPTLLTVTAPAQSAGPVDVQVSTQYGTSPSSPADQFTYLAVPEISAIAPSSGPTTGGIAVTITGTNLSGAKAVYFGPMTATITSINQYGNVITVLAPRQAAGTSDITIVGDYGTSSPNPQDRFTASSPPIVTGISPASGPTAGRQMVLISGANFTNLSSITIGGTFVPTATVVSSTTISAITPFHPAGPADVVVTTSGGPSALQPGDRYTFVAAPTIVRRSPASGTTEGGTTVVLTGTDFTDATTVTFGAVSGTIQNISPDGTVITVTSPAQDEGPVDIVVTTPSGSSVAQTIDRFTYIAKPEILNISPAGGPIAGGTRVVLNGVNFVGVTSVRFDGIAATNGTIVSSRQLIVTSPPHKPGMVHVTVSTTKGVSPATTASSYTFLPPLPLQPVLIARQKLAQTGTVIAAHIAQTSGLPGDMTGQDLAIISPIPQPAATTILSTSVIAPSLVPGTSSRVNHTPIGVAIAIALTNGSTPQQASPQPLLVQLSYDPAVLGSIQPANLTLATYDATRKIWLSLPTTIDADAHTLAAHLSQTTRWPILLQIRTTTSTPAISRVAAAAALWGFITVRRTSIAPSRGPITLGGYPTLLRLPQGNIVAQTVAVRALGAPRGRLSVTFSWANQRIDRMATLDTNGQGSVAAPALTGRVGRISQTSCQTTLTSQRSCTTITRQEIMPAHPQRVVVDVTIRSGNQSISQTGAFTLLPTPGT